MRFKFIIGVIIFFASVTSVFAEPATQIDTSDWATYKNEKFGFELKYPKYLHENVITGTVNNVPVEKVEFSTIRNVGKAPEGIQLGIQFAIQRAINPSGLSFDRWTDDQLSKLKKFNATPPLKKLVIGGRQALMLDYTGTSELKFNFHVSLNKTDILTIIVRQPLSESQHDQTYKTILSTIKFLN